MIDLNEFAKEVHENARDKGWYDKDVSFSDVAVMCHAEISEAVEEHRKGKPPLYFSGEGVEWGFRTAICVKPEGVAIELVDCVLRILDFCAYNQLDLEVLLKMKHEYNKTRPHRHGGKLL